MELAHRIRGLKVLPGQIAGEEDDIEIKVWYDNIYFTYNKLNKIYSVWCDWDTARGTSIAEVFQKWYDSDDSEISDPTDWIEF